MPHVYHRHRLALVALMMAVNEPNLVAGCSVSPSRFLPCLLVLWLLS